MISKKTFDVFGEGFGYPDEGQNMYVEKHSDGGVLWTLTNSQGNRYQKVFQTGQFTADEWIEEFNNKLKQKPC